MHPYTARLLRASRSVAARVRHACGGRTGGLGFVVVLVAAGAVGAQSPAASPGAAALPVRLVEGTCEGPGEVVIDLAEGLPAEPVPEVGAVVHVSISTVSEPIEEFAAVERVILVGGVDAASAVACGQPAAPQDDGMSVTALIAQHDSGHSGAILMRRSEDGTLIEVVIVSPSGPDEAPPPSAEMSPVAAPEPSDAGLSPVRSPLPGTSGAPPFSPLPAS